MLLAHPGVRGGSRIDIHGTVRYGTGPRIDRMIRANGFTVRYGMTAGSDIAPMNQLTLKSDSSGRYDYERVVCLYVSDLRNVTIITSVMYAFNRNDFFGNP